MGGDNLSQTIAVGAPQAPVVSFTNLWVGKIEVFVDILHSGNSSNTLSFNVRLGRSAGGIIGTIVINLPPADGYAASFARCESNELQSLSGMKVGNELEIVGYKETAVVQFIPRPKVDCWVEEKLHCLLWTNSGYYVLRFLTGIGTSEAVS